MFLLFYGPSLVFFKLDFAFKLLLDYFFKFKYNQIRVLFSKVKMGDIGPLF